MDRLFHLGAATDPFSRDDAFRQTAETRSEARKREIQESAQFERHEAVGRVDEADGYRRRLKIPQQRDELSRFDRFGDLIGKRLSNPDARARGIACRLKTAYDEPRSYGHGIFGLVLFESPGGWRLDRRISDAVVPGEVLGPFGRPARIQIRRAGTHHGGGFPDPRCDQAAVGEAPDAKGDIDMPLQKIDRDVLFQE